MSMEKLLTGCASGDMIQVSPEHLDNEMSSLSPVQANREIMETNGCRVRMFFKTKNDPVVRKEIARLLLTAFEQERNADDETRYVSVQGFDERPS